MTRLGPASRVESENSALVEVPTGLRRAVESAVGIEHNTGLRITTIRTIELDELSELVLSRSVDGLSEQ